LSGRKLVSEKEIEKENGRKRTLDLGLDIVNGIGRFHLKGDRLTRQGFDEDLHLDEGLLNVSIHEIKRVNSLMVVSYSFAKTISKGRTHLDKLSSSTLQSKSKWNLSKRSSAGDKFDCVVT
jgi:hypothetical protein